MSCYQFGPVLEYPNSSASEYHLQMKSQVDEYNLLKKKKFRQSSAQRSREERLKTKMKLSHKDRETLIRTEEELKRIRYF
jgi:replication fork clamp-binding protein CrfC